MAQAVEDGRAPDCRIVVPTRTDEGLRRRINLPAPAPAPVSDGEGGGLVRPSAPVPEGEGGGPDRALRSTVLHLPVLCAVAGHGLKKVLVYFNVTSEARFFARELPHLLRRLAATAPLPRPRRWVGDAVRPRRGHPPNGAGRPLPASPKPLP
ncbi:hypothetical protein [Streptomyces cyaneofuscatus]|uniref:hypothetical protein n=1 Tax=Streptomyces cyaneofuscatus TaxID=66883 RepID=UPI0033AF1613